MLDEELLGRRLARAGLAEDGDVLASTASGILVRGHRAALADAHRIPHCPAFAWRSRPSVRIAAIWIKHLAQVQIPLPLRS